MKVLHDNVLLKEIKRPTSDGIVPLDGGIERIEVAEIGEAVTKVKKGDTVFYYQSSPRIRIGEEEFFLTEEKQIKVIL